MVTTFSYDTTIPDSPPHLWVHLGGGNFNFFEDWLQFGNLVTIKTQHINVTFPCTNLLDLGFFRSIDSRLQKLRSFKVPAFIQQIRDTYKQYPEEKIEALVRMKKRVVACIYENEGRNDFKLPHRKK